MRLVGHWLHDLAQLALDWLPLAFFVLTGLIVYLLWRTLQVMPKVTAAKTISPKSTVSWDDVAGLDEAKGELAEVIDFLRDPERFGRLGARVPKGLLLYGPPGTGKTLLAKAIAHEAGAKFFAQSASAFVEMFAGLGAARIRKLFEEARVEMQEIVDFLKDSKRFAKLGARVPKGILLYGPPGTGKTLLARAVARESGASFYSQSASAFVEMFAGLGAARIRKLFEQARKDAPAIVFIDELDAVGAARSGHGFNREQDQTLNQLLVELDGFANRDQVIVMAASNRLQDLDPALLRPGRFDRQILVSPPDLAGREAILQVHTRGKPLAADVDLVAIARQTSGLTGADLANIANEAAIFAGRESQQHIHHIHFENAMERVIAGLQQRRVMTEKEKRILAYHEGGHALMSHLMGESFPVQKATIVPRGQALGYTFNLPQEDRYLHTREEFIDWMKIALAGRAAEQVVFGRVTNGAANDLEKVTELARSMVFEYGMSEGVVSRTMRADNYALSEETKRLRDQEQARLTDDAYEEAVRLITKHRVALDRLAQALLEKETLVRAEMMALLSDVEPESRSSETVGRVVPLSRVEDAPDGRSPGSG